MALAPWEGDRTVSPWCTLCSCWASGGHLASKGHANWALREGVDIRPDQMPFLYGLDGDTLLGVGTLARIDPSVPVGTIYWLDGKWRQPPGGPPPPPGALP